MNRIIRFCNVRPSFGWIAFALPVAFALNAYATLVLNDSYAASRFPVPYYVAQLSFDPGQLKAWYAGLIEQGTLQRYVVTQHLDFLFIVSTLLLHFVCLVFVARLLPASSRWRPAMLWCAVLSALAPLADALENGVSYIMLADPAGFSDAWAHLYSLFAALKFLMFIFAYAAALAGLTAALVFAVRRHAVRAVAN